MCPHADKLIKNIIISGVVSAANPTISKVLSLPFEPTLLEVTRFNCSAVIGVDEGAIYTITSTIIPDVLASFAFEGDDALIISRSVNMEVHDIFNLPTSSVVTTNHSFTFNTTGAGFPPGTEIKFLLNLRFTK